MIHIERKCGHYLGTEKNKKWWSRYRGEGYIARGIGEFWLNDSAFFFKHNHARKPLSILLQDIVEVRIGKWHSGKWAGGAPVAKIDWRKDNTVLSSGFVFSREGLETVRLIQRIESAVQSRK